MKRTISLFLCLLLVLTGLSAASWAWTTDYLNVTNYRYQLNGEYPNGWQEVNSNVTSLVLDGVEEGTLYVQLSLDRGFTWSPSGIATYSKQEPAEEKVVESAPVEATQTVKESQTINSSVVAPQGLEKAMIAQKETPTAAVETLSDDAKIEVIKPIKYSTISFTLAPTYQYMLLSDAIVSEKNSFGLELQIAYNDFLKLGPLWFGFEVNPGLLLTSRVGINGDWMNKLWDNSDRRSYVDIAFDTSFYSEKLKTTLSLGVSPYVFTIEEYGLFNFRNYSVGASALCKLALRYQVNRYFGVGAEIKYHYDFKPASHRVGASLMIGVGF